MINAESSILNVAEHLKDDFSLVQFDSVTKRIRRFFNNSLFNPYDFYDYLIKYVISNYKKKHKDKRVHIVIDHMFSHDNYTVLMFSMRVGNQGIPIWFRCFENIPSEAFYESLIIEGIDYCISLFNNDFSLIFLGDRWFNSIKLMKLIHDSNHFFCFRLKTNIKVSIYDKKEKHRVWKWVGDLQTYEWHSVCYDDILLSDDKFPCKIVCSKRNNIKEPWIIATNGDYNFAVKDYGYRFGAVETIFKNQKSNGFYIESICNASISSFTTMYTLVCTSVLYLTILGSEYSKNSKCYKKVKIQTHKNYKDKGRIRVMSLFQTGLTLFKIAINSLRYVRLPVRFILYDV